MNRTMRRVTVARMMTVAVGIFALAMITADASSGHTLEKGAPPSVAAKLLAKDQSIVSSWRPPGKPFDATKAKGKSAWIITNDYSIPYNHTVVNAFRDGAKKVGLRVTVIDGKSSPSDMLRGIQEAIAAHPDAIYLHGIAPSLFAAQFNSPAGKGIPVIAGAMDPGQKVPGDPKNVVAVSMHSFSNAGRMMAHFFVADSGGKGQGIVINSTDVPTIAADEKNAIVSETKRLCRGCKLSVVNVPAARWSTLTSLIPSLLRSHPDVHYILPLFDAEALYIVPAVHQAGLQNSVKVVTFNGTLGVMQSLKAGNVVAADVGQATVLEGWADLDQVLRVIAGVKPVKNVGIPERLFTAKNIRSINIKAKDDSSWYVKSNFRTKYLKLWGIAK